MKILIIEDNDIKYDLVIDCFKETGFTINSRRAASYQSGVEALVSDSFDHVILDMTLPVYDDRYTFVGTDPLTFGGELILRESARKNIRQKFIVLSQYDTFLRDEKEVTFAQLRIELMQKYPTLVEGCVRLDSSSVEWRNQLLALMPAQT